MHVTYELHNFINHEKHIVPNRLAEINRSRTYRNQKIKFGKFAQSYNPAVLRLGESLDH